MSLLGFVLLIVLILLLAGGLPHWGYAPAGWGYYSSSIVGVALIVVLILLLLGYL